MEVEISFRISKVIKLSGNLSDLRRVVESIQSQIEHTLPGFRAEYSNWRILINQGDDEELLGR